MKETGLHYYAHFMDGETEIQKEKREGTQAPWIQAVQDQTELWRRESASLPPVYCRQATLSLSLIFPLL